MRCLLTESIAIFLAGLAGCKASPPGKLETKTMTLIKHHITIGQGVPEMYSQLSGSCRRLLD